MITLFINNSYSRIEGLNPEQFEQLRNLLSYEAPRDQTKYTSVPTKRYLFGKDCSFSTGLFYLVQQYLNHTVGSVGWVLQDLREQPSPVKHFPKIKLPFNPYPEQKEAVERCLNKERGVISAVTGFGKSITMALLASMLQVKTLVVVPNLELKRQLTEDFTKYFGATDLIVIEHIGATKLKNLKDFDCLIIDEAHHSAAKTYRDLNKKVWTGIYYRFCFTATPFRSREEEQLLMESVTGRVIYEVSYHKAVQKGYVVPVIAFYVEVPKTKPRGDKTSWKSMYSELVVNNEVRNELISKLLIKFHMNKISTLCLVKEIKHGELLTCDGAFNFVSGQNDERHHIENFCKGKHSVLIGTEGVLGEGVDSKPCEIVIIAGLGKSKNAFMQKIGRSVRKTPNKTVATVIIFMDPSHKWTKSHFQEQCKILLEEYGITPTKLEI